MLTFSVIGMLSMSSVLAICSMSIMSKVSCECWKPKVYE